MKKDTNKTKVVFLMELEDEFKDQIFAFFPKMYYNKEIYKTTFTSYTHIGQHSACHIDYAKSCKLATPEQYKDLAAELESLGYNLEILTNL